MDGEKSFKVPFSLNVNILKHILSLVQPCEPPRLSRNNLHVAAMAPFLDLKRAWLELHTPPRPLPLGRSSSSFWVSWLPICMV